MREPGGSGAAHPVEVLPEVAAALAAGRPVVALASTAVCRATHRPDPLGALRRTEAAVRAAGAVPAAIAVIGGRVRIGLDAAALDHVAAAGGLAKAGLRDLAPAVAAGRDAATTVGAAAHLARLAGIRVLAAGGLGGARPGAREAWDASADLEALSRCGVALVCSGVAPLFDVGATLDRLASLNVPVVGYGTDRFPGRPADSDHTLEWRVDHPDEAARLIRACDALGLADRGVLFAQPVPADDERGPRTAALAAEIAAALVSAEHRERR
ncbi:pseudouridine-5'-phosphate glycosidase [Yinghuangia seranimata]|uniref:pseudouridine-5'-phosphate glycosidase n=1 Tax=Yinghuangia seranimata TaxID=408067 RepID=UPI00248CC28E|nr:pseudouridine-5'-phosphate glycosidase [Yinghuangia seranimata]MDI2128691.1 pseudouridine-5'-phosphate glycosidase [Yinghuangia seranimata]